MSIIEIVTTVGATMVSMQHNNISSPIELLIGAVFIFLINTCICNINKDR